MAKIILFLLLIITTSFSGELLSMNTLGGSNSLAIKSLLVKKPAELDPKMCLVVGSVFQYGDESLNVIIDMNKAKSFYASAAKRGEAMGFLILGNIALYENDIKLFSKNMRIVMRMRDEKLSIPAGLQLAAYYEENNNRSDAIYILRFLADEYNEPRSQFLIGWAIVHGELKDGFNLKDGKFYLFQACNNEFASDKIHEQCEKIDMQGL